MLRECRKPKGLKISIIKERMLLVNHSEKGVQLQAEHSDWIADTVEVIDKQEVSKHITATWQRSRRFQMRLRTNMCHWKGGIGDSNVTPTHRIE
ncbi:hypothetical protein Tco_0446315 [Tanacetum coccineum]